MAQAAYASLLLINPAHTAGQDLPSDIVMPQDLMEPLCHAVNDDVVLYAESLYGIDDFLLDDDDDDDIDAGDGEVMGDFADDDDTDEASFGAVWVWRKPRLRKG